MIVTWLSTVSIASAALTVELGGNGIERQNGVATVVLPSECDDWTDVVATSADGVPVSAQISSGTPPQLFLLVDRLRANEYRRVEVRPRDDQSTELQPSRARIVDQDGSFRVFVDDQMVLQYNHAMIESPPGLDPVYRRSGHIHPLFTPSGRLVTDDFCPSDHTHQHGVMFAWTNCSFEGRKVNFWEQKNRQAVVRHSATRSVVAGPVFAELKTTISHIDITSGKEIPVLSEDWRVRVYNVTDHFVFDLRSSQRCVADSPLTVNQYHYGGMAIRGHRSWTARNSGFLTSNGKVRDGGNHDRPNWCDMSGRVDDGVGGVTLYCHPGNFRAPQSVRLHPSMPYFCYAPLVLGDFQISADKPFVSNYRFVTHDSEVDTTTANRLWADYAHPITASIVPSP